MIANTHLLTMFLLLGKPSESMFEVEKFTLTIDDVEQDYKLGGDNRQVVRRTETINAGLDIRLAKNVKNLCAELTDNCSVVIEVIVYVEHLPVKYLNWELKAASFEPGYVFSYITGPVKISEQVPFGDAEIYFRFLKGKKELEKFRVLLEIKDSTIVIGN